jgi:AcrR family transcriptional regulator
MSTYSKSERTKQLIIEKSAVLFNKKGFAGTSLSDITDATQLTKGALYGHFTDKEQIGRAVFEYNSQFILNGFQKYINKELTVSGKFSAMLRFYAENAVELTRLGGCPFMNAIVEFDDQPGTLKTLIKERFGQWEGTINDILVQGQQNGEIKLNTDTKLHARLFVSMIEGALLITHLMGDPSVLIMSFEQMSKIISADLTA